MKILNHDITMSTLDESPGVHLFSGRALGLSQPGDHIYLHPDLSEDWAAIRAHYDRVGLSYSDSITWSIDFQELGSYSSEKISVYFFGSALASQPQCQEMFYSLDSDWCDVVQYINSKNNFMELAQQLGVEVPHTRCFKNRSEVGDLNDFDFPCYTKLAVADHGVGIWRCKNPEELLEAIHQIPEDRAFQVQSEVRAIAFLNLQYQVTDEGLQRSIVSEQILNGCVHGGNRYPSVHQPWDTVEPIAQWMAERGMKGTFAFDVAVVETPNSLRYCAIECNPRFNGSSYPTEVAQQLGIDSWCSATVEVGCCSLTDLNLDGLEFDPTTKSGVVLINWGTIQVGKLSVLLAGSVKEQERLSSEIQKQWAKQPAVVSS